MHEIMRGAMDRCGQSCISIYKLFQYLDIRCSISRNVLLQLARFAEDSCIARALARIAEEDDLYDKWLTLTL